MNAAPTPLYVVAVIAFVNLLALFTLQVRAQPQDPKAIVPYIQERLGLDDYQVRGGLGALLVFARERLPKTQFDQLARRMPNAEMLMGQTQSRGIVTGPLDDEDEFEAALTKLGMPLQAATQFASVVQDYLGIAGYYEERDVLSRVFD